MSVDNLRDGVLPRTLVVVESGVTEPTLNGLCSHRLSFSYTDIDAGDGFAAWQVAETAEQTHIHVHSSCTSIAGGYRQQALNRFLSKALMVHRPDLVIVCGIAGCTLDLTRVAALFGVPCVLFLPQNQTLESVTDAFSMQWLESCLSSCAGVFLESEYPVGIDASFSNVLKTVVQSDGALTRFVAALRPAPLLQQHFDYAVYELCSRDHPLLVKMQEPDAVHFFGLDNVLDVGCGAGLFLDILRRQGIQAMGVEQNSSIAHYGRGMGLNIEIGDALSFLAQGDSLFQGVYCSHFVEHLPIEAVEKLIRIIATRLMDNGVFVLVFPDPESIRSQLLGFWRDPEHVRFYHRDLIISIAALAGFEVEWTSYQEQPHSVGFFPETPDPIEGLGSEGRMLEVDLSTKSAKGFFELLLAKFGLVSSRRADDLENRLARLAQVLTMQEAKNTAVFQQLADRTERLWQVNSTWAWNDNVTIKLRKRHRAV